MIYEVPIDSFCDVLHRLGDENKTPSPTRRVLKPWGEAREGKLEEDNIC